MSNFNVLHLEKLIEARPHDKPVGKHNVIPSSIPPPPPVNQVEITPFLTREELVSYCQSQNIVIETYSPLTKGRLLNDPGLVAIAKK